MDRMVNGHFSQSFLPAQYFHKPGEKSIFICDNPYTIMIEGVSIELSALTIDQSP